MSVELAERLLADVDPAFACYASRDRAKKEAFVAPLTHRANPPADPSLLLIIPPVPGAETSNAFYLAHEGGLFYAERESLEGEIEIFPIREWKQRTYQMVQSWLEDIQYYPGEGMPYGPDFIAFPHSRGACSYVH